MDFQKEILVYIPTYNCAKYIRNVILHIPRQLHNRIEVLVVDNLSTDHTCEMVREIIGQKQVSFALHLVQPKTNLGYAGSQKMAYSIARHDPRVKKVIMLHGDGQYDSELLKKLEPYFQSDAAVVQGYRDKSIFGQKEETPLSTYLIIKTLSFLESLLTGYRQKEWHSGFVIYSTDFLRQLPLAKLSDIPHIDGEMLICANLLDQRIEAVPIYKKYKDYDPFSGMSRLKHVLSIWDVIRRLWSGYYRDILSSDQTKSLDQEYELVASTFS